ncbi:MAG TPA: hypothetical protein VEI99_09135 [Terriglobales bacterium]|nr:hypothetical protein [Terriglobales bacterium]
MTEPTIVRTGANPALDRRLGLRTLSVGKVHRLWGVASLPGGEAAPVATVAVSRVSRAKAIDGGIRIAGSTVSCTFPKQEGKSPLQFISVQPVGQDRRWFRYMMACFCILLARLASTP